MAEPRAGILLTVPIMALLLTPTLTLLGLLFAFVGDVRTNRSRLDGLERDVAALQAHDEESAKDRRDLGTRLYRLEGVRIAPARGRE